MEGVFNQEATGLKSCRTELNSTVLTRSFLIVTIATSNPSWTPGGINT